MNRRSLFVGALAVFAGAATDALALPTQELPDYIRINARDTIRDSFGLHNMEFKINKMEQDACIQMNYDFLDDIYASYTLSYANIIDMIEEQHPELKISMVDEDGIDEEVRFWIEVKPGAHFDTVPFDPGPYASDQRKNLTLKLPSDKQNKMREDAIVIHRMTRSPVQYNVPI